MIQVVGSFLYFTPPNDVWSHRNNIKITFRISIVGKKSYDTL
jgi:hypothetical protein